MKTIANCRELTAGYQLNAADVGVTATRVYVYDGQAYRTSLGSFSAQVPDIGDPYSSVLTSNLICRSRTKKFVGDDPRKWILTCNYSAEPFDPGEFGKPVSGMLSRPVSMSFGGDFMQLTPVSTGYTNWVFQFGKDAVSGAILSQRVATNKIHIQVYKSDAAMNGYLGSVFENLGKINGTLTPPSTPGDPIEDVGVGGGDTSSFSNWPGCWLFSSFAAENYMDYRDKKMWRCELIFEFRTLSGKNYGWLEIIDNNGNIIIPYFAKDKYPSCFIYPMSTDPSFGNVID